MKAARLKGWTDRRISLPRVALIIGLGLIASRESRCLLSSTPIGGAGGGWEYPLFWELIWVAILMRGGGPYSIDRKLGREL